MTIVPSMSSIHVTEFIYKLNESKEVITSSIQEVVKVSCQDYKDQLLNHTIIPIEPINI